MDGNPKDYNSIQTAYLQPDTVGRVVPEPVFERDMSSFSSRPKMQFPHAQKPGMSVSSKARIAGHTRLVVSRSSKSLQGTRRNRQNLVVRADRESGSFWSGVAIGGVVCGVLGFVFAPQISQALLGDDQRLRLPRFLEEEDDDPEVTKQNLAEKIAQLNSAIDDVSSQLKARESMDEEITA